MTAGAPLPSGSMNTTPDGLRPGDPAPDLVLPDAGNQPVQLSALWRAAPLALVFIRHYG